MLTRKQREDELLGMAAGKLERVLRKKGLVWDRARERWKWFGEGGEKGVRWIRGKRRDVVRELLGVEYRKEDDEAERVEKRGRKRIRDAMSAEELREEIRELLWDLWEEGQKPVAAARGTKWHAMAARGALGTGSSRTGKNGRELEGGGVGAGGDQEAKKRIRRALRLRGWKGGLENENVKKVMGKMRPSREVGMKKAWLEIEKGKREMQGSMGGKGKGGVGRQEGAV